MRPVFASSSFVTSLGALLGVVALAVGSVGCETKKGAAGGDGAVPVTVTDKGFEPKSVTFKKGTNATMVFTRTTEDTCAKEVVFPELAITKDLPKGTPVSISIPTDKEQTLTFQCGMGMYKSSVVVSAN